MNRSIAVKMNYFARCIKFNIMIVTSEWMLLGSALSKGRALLGLKGIYDVHNIMNAMMIGGRL
jgi:hypothetical protein